MRTTWHDLKERLLNTECDNCGNLIPVVASRTTPTGVVIPMQLDAGAVWNLGGGYAEFIDTLPEQNHEVYLCHDCCVLVFKALPGVAKRFSQGSKGWHPYEGDTPCCEWGWR